MTYKAVYTDVEVDVDISEFDTEDLIEELESRGELVGSAKGESAELVRHIYEKRRLGQDFNRELDELIYLATGKIV